MVLEVELRVTVILDRVLAWCCEWDTLPYLLIGKNPMENIWNHVRGSVLELWTSSKGEVNLRLRCPGM